MSDGYVFHSLKALRKATVFVTLRSKVQVSHDVNSGSFRFFVRHFQLCCVQYLAKNKRVESEPAMARKQGATEKIRKEQEDHASD